MTAAPTNPAAGVTEFWSPIPVVEPEPSSARLDAADSGFVFDSSVADRRARRVFAVIIAAMLIAVIVFALT